MVLDLWMDTPYAVGLHRESFMHPYRTGIVDMERAIEGSERFHIFKFLATLAAVCIVPPAGVALIGLVVWHFGP